MGRATRVRLGVGPSRPAGASRPDGLKPSWYAADWGRLATAITGRPVGPEAAEGRNVARGIAAEAERHRGLATFAETVGGGGSLEEAMIAATTTLTGIETWHGAWSLAEGVASLPAGETASRLGHAVILHRRGQLRRSWIHASRLDDATLRHWIPVEAVDGALADGSPEARSRALAIGVPESRMNPATLVDLAGRFLAMGERDAAAASMAELLDRPSAEVDDRRRYARRLIEGWLEPSPREVPAGAVPIGLLAYRTPDPVLASGNLGDYVQTLALLGNIARLGDVTFTGDEGLGEVAAGLGNRVQPALRVPGVAGAVHLLPVDRDFSSAGTVPEGTWLPAFGWHMHPLFDLRYDFPYHPNIRPLFMSFHVNRLDMLSEEALEYLRRYGPVGCRDWTTVYLLLSAGVDAFFTGCLTSTVDALFPERSSAFKGGDTVGVIDQPAKAAGDARRTRSYTHQSDEYRFLPLADGIRAADARLAEYQATLARAVTGRLHAYLPMTSLGVPVDFRTRNPGDIRFAGLAGLAPGDPALVSLRDGIRDLTAAVFGRILSGASEEEVYATWREIAAPKVAEAKGRFAARGTETPTGTDIEAAVRASWARSRRSGPHDAVDPDAVADIVLCFDQNLTSQAPVVVESILEHATMPVRLWILARGLSDAYQEWFCAAFPDLPITFLPCDPITYGLPGRRLRIPYRITVSTMDRLLLPHMLGDVRRVVYLDVDTLVLGDIGELFRLDLGGRPIAARDSNVSEDSEWQRAGRALPEPVATDLRRRMGALHGFGHPALNAGVLVMDLDRLRQDDFTRTYLGWAERYGFHDQDTMLAYAGPARCVLPPRWNALPTLEEVEDPALIHWASFPKPWHAALTFERDRWQAVAARLQARAGLPPGEGAGSPGTLDSPLPVGPALNPVAPAVERTIAAVRSEHLSYLNDVSLRTLAATMAEIEAAGLQGLVIETGTARGGSAIVLAASKAPNRPMRVYDVFGMIPPPSARDDADVHRRYATIVAGESQGIGGETYYGYREDLEGEVTASFARHGLPLDERNVQLVAGLFQDTLIVEEPVALAHLDGDWYESTMTCLERIAPRLVVGGRIVLDDYDTWSGCRTAVHEYFADRPGFRFERRGRLHIVRT